MLVKVHLLSTSRRQTGNEARLRGLKTHPSSDTLLPVRAYLFQVPFTSKMMPVARDQVLQTCDPIYGGHFTIKP